MQINKHLKATTTSALISVSDHPKVSIAVAHRYSEELDGFSVVGKRNKKLVFAEGPDLESLVLFRIYPAEIKHVQKVTNPDFRAATGY